MPVRILLLRALPRPMLCLIAGQQALWQVSTPALEGRLLHFDLLAPADIRQIAVNRHQLTGFLTPLSVWPADSRAIEVAFSRYCTMRTPYRTLISYRG